MRRRGRGREEEEKRRGKRRSQAKRYGTIWFCRNFHAIGWLLVVSKPRVLLGFHPNPKILKGKVGKIQKGTRSI